MIGGGSRYVSPAKTITRVGDTVMPIIYSSMALATDVSLPPVYKWLHYITHSSDN